MRRWIRWRVLLLTSLLMSPTGFAGDGAAIERSISFVHTHTGEAISVVYRRGGVLVPEAIERLSHFLRDHRTDEMHSMDPEVFDLLWDIREAVASTEPFHIVSGYRSPETNEKLRQAGRGVVKNSLHLKGQAIDFRLPGTDTARLRDVAVALKRGGVGFYRKSDFLHVDTGRVRQW